MSTKTVQVPNISCRHCVATIERELADLTGVTGVHADVASKQVEVVWQPPADWAQIAAVLDEIGYPPAEG